MFRWLNQMRRGLLISMAALLLGSALGCTHGASSSGALPTDFTPLGDSDIGSEGVSAERDSVSIIANRLMALAAENESLSLYIDPETTEIAVRRKDTGTVWLSNPELREADPVAQGAVKGELASQLVIRYYAGGELLQSMDNFAASIRHRQFAVERIESGVKVTYQFGKEELGKESVPNVIRKERFESLIWSKATEEEQAYLNAQYKPVSLEDAGSDAEREELLEQYPRLEQSDVYVLSKYIPDFEIPKLHALLQTYGYTTQDLAHDHEENGIAFTVKDAPGFHISIEYVLDGEHLVATVPLDEMEYRDSYPPYAIELLKYFGAADHSREGYLFIPDGSGALIHFNNHKQQADAISIPVYGPDPAIRRIEETYRTEKAAFPVYGLKAGDAAFLAILEQGESLAHIAADIAGRRTSYHHVHPQFVLKPKDDIMLETGNGQKKLNVFQEEIYDDKLQIRYVFLDGQDADYSGMAKAYREHLEANGVLVRRTKGEDIPFYLELTGAIRKKYTVLGTPYTGIEPLTTFDQAIDILEQLRDQGVHQINVRYSGWFNGGLAHSIPTKIKPVRKLGGTSGFGNLIDYTIERGIDLFPDTAFLNVYRNTSGFSPGRDAVRFLNKNVAALYRISPASNQAEFDGDYRFLLAPARLERVVDRFLSAFRKFDGTEQLFLRDLGSVLYSDFRSGKQVHRQQSRQIVESQLRTMQDSGLKLGMDAAHRYALPYADYILNVPTDSSRYFLADESIPFYQMVLRGYIDYAGEPLNRSADVRKAMLRAVETGSGVHFSWIYADNTEVKKTAHNDLFMVQYDRWLDEAGAFYRRYNAEMKSVRDEPITRHEILADHVRRTTFADGTSVIVNYSDSPVTIDGIVVPGNDYALTKGGTASE